MDSRVKDSFVRRTARGLTVPFVIVICVLLTAVGSARATSTAQVEVGFVGVPPPNFQNASSQCSVGSHQSQYGRWPRQWCMGNHSGASGNWRRSTERGLADRSQHFAGRTPALQHCQCAARHLHYCRDPARSEQSRHIDPRLPANAAAGRQHRRRMHQLPLPVGSRHQRHHRDKYQSRRADRAEKGDPGAVVPASVADDRIRRPRPPAGPIR